MGIRNNGTKERLKALEGLVEARIQVLESLVLKLYDKRDPEDLDLELTLDEEDTLLSLVNPPQSTEPKPPLRYVGD